MSFQDMLRQKMLDVIDLWPADDQYAIMLFIYPNKDYEYRGYNNIPEFSMLYRCESDLTHQRNPIFTASTDAENRWNPAFWDYNQQIPIISFDSPNLMADALIDWYEATGLTDIGQEDQKTMYDDQYLYIGKGPNGLQELLQAVVEITADMQNNGIIRNKYGREIPVILADFEFTWYMVKATKQANPNGEADMYIQDCIDNGWSIAEQLQ